LIRKALPLLAAALFASTLGGAHAQTTAPPTALERQVEKLDLSVAGVGIYNSTVTGTVVTDLGADNQGQSITEHGSNTLGALVSIHYIARPYVGLEFNYGYARYDENFTGPGIANYFLPPNTPEFKVQSKVNEYTFGYLITPPHPVFGWQPFVSVGAGTQAFKPTPLGGQEEPEKARMTYYYSLGLQKNFGQHLGLRAGFRELFFLDPDFGQNYLTILQHATTLEPMAGFYLRY
jgi:hypothetical protein